MNSSHVRNSMLSLVVVAVLVAVAAGGAGPEEPEFTSDFNIESCRIYLPHGGNEYFSLRPGTFHRLEGEDDGAFVEVEIRVLWQVQPIVFHVNGHWVIAITRVIEEREWEDGELIEVSRNYFATRPGSRDVYYFGEDVDIYEDGEVVSHEGAWIVGEDGALPGLIMPDLFLLGARYFQEIAPDIALDRAEHTEMDLVVDTPAGEFDHVVKVVETTPLEPDEESIKMYAPGVGIIVDDALELVEYHR